ncbi:MAG TPA: 23S rRNA (pseudouridine(1915)-N(3))-methyltransferase RlmH [Terriglobales bacterium]|nr:23S rRNA (pseudouridine(1915)-N(3))-methyltransferase RlmH [Terriglobales bacterium]
MKLRVAWIQAKPGKNKHHGVQSLTAEYVQRIGRYVPIETRELASESGLFKDVGSSKKAPILVLLDSRGKQMSSEELAAFVDKHQQMGTQHLWFAVGGADGFSEMARKSAATQLSLGKMTLPHELARVVLLEQLYRAFTILKGHPYHTGH